jgi:deoxyadenosine/deoxycytidine kinase
MNKSTSFLPIVIDGNIGSGKTTALKLLKCSQWIQENQFTIVDENVDEWAPYLAEFYVDMRQNALLFQMKVLQHHMKQYPYDATNNFRPSKITERSPLSCLYVFGENLHNGQLMNDLERQLMVDMNNDFGWMPETVFYIDTPPETCYERIHIRSRENEIIPLNYLKDIDNLYTNVYKTTKSVHPRRPKEVYLIDGTKTPDQVLKQIIEILQLKYSWCTTNRYAFSQ